MTISEEKRKNYIKALLEERKGYEQYGNDKGAELVDAELKAAGYYRNQKPRKQRESKPSDARGARKTQASEPKAAESSDKK